MQRVIAVADMKGFPRRFGPYALAKPLARGGMGALYLAVRPDRQPDVCVIKTVLPHLADKEYLQRFRDEGKVVVRLSHENLVPVFDSGQVGGEIYLGMDFVDGRDLRAIWNRCAKKGVAFPIDVAAYIVREVALGLHYAHTFADIRLVHRDVSPPNVLVAFDGSVKLTDFGLASSTLKLEKTAPGIIYGKVSYMSPEQARGETLDGRTDLFAAGIILWELLTGRQVYPAKNPRPAAGSDEAAQPQQDADELLRRVRRPVIVAPSQRASRVPPELDRIALLALAPKLEDRYPDCATLARDLTAYLVAKHPATDGARVAQFLASLYGDDLEADRAAREKALGDARSLGTKPRPQVGNGVDDAPSMTLSGTSSADAAGAAGAGSPAANDVPARTRASSPPGPFLPPSQSPRSERGTLIGGPGGRAMARARDEVSAAFADPLPSSSNPGGASVSVIGTLIGGRYRVKRLSGEGGMGRVYEAEHIEIGKRVALKILHPGYSQTPDLVERLRREARAASRIGHPNVVDVTDSGTTEDGSFFFVMEYLEGRELGDIVFEEKGLDVRRSIGIAVQMCRALRAAHMAGVIHRDLKPENVLLVSRDGQKDFVKVLDFGIAKNITDGEDNTSEVSSRRKLTNPGVAMGTPEYMAPEQAAGRPADARSDIYAVGGVMYEMLAGRPAYEGSNFMEVLHKKANFPPEPLHQIRDDVPRELEDLILKAMAKDPGARPQTMEELEQRLQEVLAQHFAADPAGTTSGARGETPRPVVLHGPGRAGASRSERAWWGRRRVAAVGAAAACLVLGIILVAVGPSRGHSGTPATTTIAAGAHAPLRAPVGPAAVPAVRANGAKPSEPTLAATAPPSRAELPAVEPEGERVESSDAAGPTGGAASPSGPRRAASADPSGALPLAEARKQMKDAEALLRAQKFREASAIFTRLTKNRATRGRALVALAEIAFQEKNYAETIRSAKLATAAERGRAGARAHVLLGDAHFRLNEYPAAVTAYEQALRLEPGNPSAKSGLALASKRM
jgi:serine/threonine protein kinase